MTEILYDERECPDPTCDGKAIRDFSQGPGRWYVCEKCGEVYSGKEV